MHVHLDKSKPYPVPTEVRIEEDIPYCWNEYCEKFVEKDEMIADWTACTLAGEPIQRSLLSCCQVDLLQPIRPPQ